MNTNHTDQALFSILTDISGLHDAISQGNATDQALMEQLNRIRKTAFDHLHQEQPAEDAIVAGYFQDTANQARRFAELVAEADRSGMTPSSLIGLAYCADLVATKAYRFFHLRNQRAARRIQAGDGQ